MLSDLYARKSNKDDGSSVEAQEDDWRDDCEQEGLEPGEVFADPWISASRYSKKMRDDWPVVLERIRTGRTAMLALWESSRGTRKLSEWVEFLDLCRDMGCLIRIISSHETYDVRKRAHRKTLLQEGVDAEDSSEQTSERVQRGKRKAAQKGLPSGPVGDGWRRTYGKDGKVNGQVPDPERAPVIKEIIERIAKDDEDSSGEIARDLNQRGVLTSRGCQWTARQVRQIAINPSYAGLRVHKDKVTGKGCWEPLVDPDTWKIAYAKLTAPGRKLNRDSRLAHWLSGAVRCGLCVTATLRAVTRGQYGFAYQCRRCFKVSAAGRAMELTVERALLHRIKRTDALEWLAPGTDEAALRRAEAEEAELRAELQSYYDLPPGKLSAEGLVAREEKLLPLIRLTEEKVRRLSVPPVLAKLADVDIVAAWPDLPVLVKRDIVVAVVDLVLGAGAKDSGPRFDPTRLSQSRWRGDDLTWGEHWSTV